MKIYKDNGKGGLEGVCSLPRTTTDDVFVSEGFQIYILLYDPSHGAWLTNDGQRISLWNVHLTGELRWSEPGNGSFRDPFTRLSFEALLATKHFDLRPSILTQDEWRAILDSYTIRSSDLSECEIEMLKEAAENELGECKIICDEKDGRERYGSMYRLKQKNLIDLAGSVSFAGRTTEFFRITKRGRALLRDGSV